ncbi:MAG: cobalamin B12-binding domain-containing protein [Ardenticatenaceae bacterium]|nr:cobalamin-dependent protein [Anaerolineales bacterium]MCB8922220.1 cobalamin B12-binding domain-containing protein [Ardenticatenaceae bacterium]
MIQPITTPAFNMKVIVQETGIKPDTLRAWERRYGLPDPQRTDGGHRLYSEYDIALVKWLMGRQVEGMSISRAVKMLKQLQETGQDPLLSSVNKPPLTSPLQISGDMIVQAREAWIQACLQFNEYEAHQILTQAYAIYPVELVSQEVLQKGLAAIGESWYRGEATVQQEHFASELAVRQLEALLTSMVRATRHGRILIACPPQEQHTFGALLLTLLLRRRGWDVVYLGANVPLHQLQEALDTIQPHLVILSAQTLHTAGTMLEMADFLQANNVPLTFGGAVFHQLPAVRQHIPGHFLNKLEDAPLLVEKLFQSADPFPPVQRATETHRIALAAYQQHWGEITTAVHHTLAPYTIPADWVQVANVELHQNMTAALTLGNINLLGANIDWIRGLLFNFKYPLPDEALTQYLTAYRDAITQYLTIPEAAFILEWFTAVIGE